MNDWRINLGNFLTEHNRKSRAEKDAARFRDFLSNVALPALQEVGNELKKYGRTIAIRQTEAAAVLAVTMEDEEEISFYVMYRTLTDAAIVPCAEARYQSRKTHAPRKANIFFRNTSTPYTLDDITKDEIIQGFLEVYRKSFED